MSGAALHTRTRAVRGTAGGAAPGRAALPAMDSSGQYGMAGGGRGTMRDVVTDEHKQEARHKPHFYIYFIFIIVLFLVSVERGRLCAWAFHCPHTRAGEHAARQTR